MNKKVISKTDLQQLLNKEKEIREQREKYYANIIDAYDHLDMELNQVMRHRDNLKLKELEYIEFIEKLRDENESLRKEIKKACSSKESKNSSTSNEDLKLIQSIHKRQLEEMEGKIKTLQDKLGNNTVPLSTLAEGIKSYAEETSIEKAHEFFERLNSILFGEKAWVDNVKQLKRFFQEQNKKNKKYTIEHADQVVNIAEKDSKILHT
jgi:hypothetical protein